MIQAGVIRREGVAANSACADVGCFLITERKGARGAVPAIRSWWSSTAALGRF